MKKSILFVSAFALMRLSAASQAVEETIANNYEAFNKCSAYFNKAYTQYPEIPRGVLEAVSFTNTRFHHIAHEEGEAQSCTGIPKAYGVMGLTLDGKNAFKNNLVLISELSGYSIEEIIVSPEKNILAYAKSYSVLKKQAGITGNTIESQIPLLVELSELPVSSERSDITIGQDFAANANIYSILDFLNKAQNQSLYNLPQRNIDFINVFGQENYNVLSAPSVVLSDGDVTNRTGNTFKGGKLPGIMSPDYGPALWVAACPNNYDVGRSMAVSAIAIHQMDGTYAGTISWFASCSNPYYTSTEYVLRSSDGQITQMVLESNTTHHVYTENAYTIGLEHEGYILQNGWYTTAMYNASAALVRDICSRKGISPLTCWYGISCNGNYNQCLVDQCIRIKGHNQFPNGGHTDPGVYWDWKRYYLLLNPMPSVTPLTAASGTIYDSGGASGNYKNTERPMTLIAPTGATKVTLTFSSFNMEANADHLLIYDGNTTAAPLIGKYTGTSLPPTVSSTGGAMLVEFRSDCSQTFSGWAANWTSNGSTTPPPAAVYKLPYPNGVTYTCTQGNGGSISHTGIPQYAYDIAMPIGASISAARAGTVSHVVESYVDYNNTGNCNDVNRVVVDHGDGTSALYLHLTNNGALVNVGDKVIQGQVIAKAGSSGCSTGSHLHFQVMNAGTYGSWYNQSIQTKFCDVSTNNGILVSGSAYTSSPCGSSDVTAPTTSIITPNGFATGNFTASFTDADNTGGSGLKKSFYHVIDNNGTDWRGNKNNGFIRDNFNGTVTHADWTKTAGTWAVSAGVLKQSDVALANTIMSSGLTQNLSSTYMYHWTGKIEGTGTNKRAGLHFMCSSGTTANRGNSYMVWFRADQSTVEIYESVNDVLGSPVKTAAVTITAGVYYDYKVIYDRTTGVIDVYVNNVKVVSWTDVSPIQTGSYISFRSGNCIFSVDDVYAYRSRTGTATISVGAAATNDIRYQNASPTANSAIIKSIAVDNAGNISTVGSKGIHVDFTAAAKVSVVRDGTTTTDISTTTSSTQLSANWPATTDANSGITKYQYAIGKTAGATDVVNWTNNGTAITVTKTGLTLTIGQLYYVSVRSVNGAGLVSAVATSNGQKAVTAAQPSRMTPEIAGNEKLFNLNAYPNPFKETITVGYELTEDQEVIITLIDVLGKSTILYSNKNQIAGSHNMQINTNDLNLSNGFYLIKVKTAESESFIRTIHN